MPEPRPTTGCQTGCPLSSLCHTLSRLLSVTTYERHILELAAERFACGKIYDLKREDFRDFFKKEKSEKERRMDNFKYMWQARKEGEEEREV